MSDEQITTGEGGENTDPTNTEKVDANEGLRKQIQKEIEDEIVRQLLEERSDSGVYKGIQRVVSKKDKEKDELARSNAKLAADFEELRRQFGEATELYNYTSGVLYNNLPDSEKQRVSAELSVINSRRQQSQIEAMRRQMQAGQQQQQVQQPDGFQETLERARAEADEALRDTVVQFGLDPEDKALDFGDRDEAFASRLKRLNKSLVSRRAELAEKDKADVKPKVAVTPTRTGSGSGAGLSDSLGKSTLQRGSQAVLERVRAQMAAR